MASAEKSSTGLDASVAGGLAVLLGWIGGLVFYLIEKDSKFVRFYALQSIAISIGYCLIPFLELTLGVASRFGGPMGWALKGVGGLLWTALFVCWIIMIINAFQGRLWDVPLVGPACRRQVGL